MDSAIAATMDMAIGVSCAFFVLICEVANVAGWCFIGLCCCWWHAFKSQGLLRTREPVEDNVSPFTCVVMHMRCGHVLRRLGPGYGATPCGNFETLVEIAVCGVSISILVGGGCYLPSYMLCGTPPQPGP